MPTRTRRMIVDTPDGQVHVRTVGQGEPVILLHWTPGSGRQYQHVLAELAARGYRAIAPDHMGFGFSDGRPKPWAVSDYAQNILDVMTGLGLESAHVAGGHFSSEIGVEMVLRAPARVKKLVLDGSPVWSRDLREKILASARPEEPKWSEGGDHIVWIWQRAAWLRKMWNPTFVLNDQTASILKTAVMENILAGNTDDTSTALKDYDLDLALPRITVPTLALTAETDPLTNCHADVLRLVPGVHGHRFAGVHPLHQPERSADYVRVLHAFLSDTASELFHTASTFKAGAGSSYETK
jgi:pimeloyl-ACP methyl ester carboxylesterase